MKYLILLLICVTLSGCIEEKPNGTDNQNRLLGEWHSTAYNNTITFHQNTYTSNFVGEGNWSVNGRELILNNNTYDYEFLGNRLHIMPLYLFFEKD